VYDGSLLDGDTTAGVLICDDNDAMRGLLRAIVDSAPTMRVVGEAADGNEAIVEAARLHPDVILLDLAMPKLSGFEALPELRRVAPDARIVVLSGFAGSSVAQQIIALGAAAYLEKGAADPETIVAAIEEALARTRGLPPSLTTTA
jgi:DNA-binding NarL/FixJ family response regulator